MTAMAYFQKLWTVLGETSTTDVRGARIPFEETISSAREIIRSVPKRWFIGNGGSAGIVSHMAADFTKNGFPSLVLTDQSLLTCFSNDFGYENAFALGLKAFAADNDLLIAVSSSGASNNILNAADHARGRGMPIITMSGFSEDNPLRSLGLLNFWVPSNSYGFVECAHQVLLHAILDLEMGIPI